MKRAIPHGEFWRLAETRRETRPAPHLRRFVGKAARAYQVACDVMDEALDASRMVTAGYSLDRIRAEIDRKYGR